MYMIHYMISNSYAAIVLNCPYLYLNLCVSFRMTQALTAYFHVRIHLKLGKLSGS